MKTTIRKALVLLITLSLLLSPAVPALAKTGPYTPDPDDEFPWNYARLELRVLDENEEQVYTTEGEGDDQYKVFVSLPLYVDGEATAVEGAVYDPATNTLTLTDFNKANYILDAVLMGDDFTLCVKGDCRLTGIEVHGGGVLFPLWGCGLRITGDGTLAVNPNKKLESGIFFGPQEEPAFSFTVDSGVTLTVGGKVTAIEAFGYCGEFTFTVDGEIRPVAGKTAVREVNLDVEGYNRPMELYIWLGSCADDPSGTYAVTENWPVIWVDGEPVKDENGTPWFTVERYIYLESYDAYVEDHAWEQAHATDEDGTEVRFSDLAAAEAAGFTPVLDENGEQKGITVNYFGNSGSYDVYEDAEGKRYGVGFGPDDEGHYGRNAYTFEEIPELPGEYIFTFANGVDPASLTEITVERVYEDHFDYAYPEKEFIHNPAAAPALMYGDVDGSGEITPGDARLALRISLGLMKDGDMVMTDEMQARADVDGKDGVQPGDARLILRKSLGLTDEEWRKD